MAVAFPPGLDQPTPLLGRTAELDAVEQLLTEERVRLLSLVGPAGVGKTRLALEAASRVAAGFRDGVTIVDLSPVREPDLVIPAIAQALGVLDTGPDPALSRLQENLRERATLLVLDNFEQVVAAGSVIPQLLSAAPELIILVTSRVPLRLRWEQTLRVSPLPVPRPDDSLELDQLLRMPSVALFVDRARAQHVDFNPTEHQVPALVQLTRQLDGLPLAIELAAANTSALSLAVIARHLDRHLETLEWDAQDLPIRQRSLQAAIGWSYELLSDHEQRAFRALGVFVGRVSLDAIEAVMGDSGTEVAFSSIVSLAEKSLVLPAPQDTNDAEPSFCMLETVRQFAREQLDSQGELVAAGRSHAGYFLDLAEQAEPRLRRHGQAEWYARLEAEHDNLRAALRWLLDNDEGELALRLAGSLGYFWYLRGYHREAERWLEEALQRAPDADPAVRAKALGRLGGMLIAYGGDLERARNVLEESLALARQHNLRSLVALPLDHLGARATILGDTGGGLRLLGEALEQAEEHGDDSQVGSTLAALGYRSLTQGHYQEAIDHFSAALARFLASGNQVSATVNQPALAVAMHRLGKLDRAIQIVQEALQSTLASRNRWHLRHALEATAILLGERGDPQKRARLLGALDTLAWSTGARYTFPMRQTDQDVADPGERLDQERLETARKAGRSMSFAEVVALASTALSDLSLALDHPGSVTSEPMVESSLTPREREILRLVAEGLTSKQIAQQLFLSPRTVDHHMYLVFNKLGVDSRAQAVAVAARERLL